MWCFACDVCVLRCLFLNVYHAILRFLRPESFIAIHVFLVWPASQPCTAELPLVFLPVAGEADDAENYDGKSEGGQTGASGSKKKKRRKRGKKKGGSGEAAAGAGGSAPGPVGTRACIMYISCLL